MPQNVYDPQWDVIKKFYDRMSPVLPADYTGLLGIRLHRTGNPVRLALFGSALPDGPLFPVALIELSNGERVEDWDTLETEFSVPWVNEDDFLRYCKDVMAYYQEEDKLEPLALEILADEPPEEEVLKQAIVVGAGAAVG